jgi:hypothetical protein
MKRSYLLPLIALGLSSFLASSPLVSAVSLPLTEDFLDSGSNPALDPDLDYDFDLSTAGLQGPGATGIDFSNPDDNLLSGGSLSLFPDEFRVFAPSGVQQIIVSGTSFDSSPDTIVTAEGFDSGGSPLTISETFQVVSGPEIIDFDTGSSYFGGSISHLTVSSLEADIDTITFVPEPSTNAAIIGGLAALGVFALRRRQGGTA